jgi:NitT/TauT family transport system substrate-binding protein
MNHSIPGVLLLLIATLLAGCGAAPVEAPVEAPAGAPTTVRMGYIPVIIFAPIYVGIERGYFAAENINIELSTVTATNDAVVQLAAGNFDMALAGGNAGVFNALSRGLEFTIVAPMHSESPPVATPLVISANRTDEITSAADLAGKTVGINANGAAIEYWVDQALAQAGLSIADVELRAMPFPNMPAALENGSLDAAVITEPLVTINRQQGIVAVLAEDFIDGFTATYVFVNPDWLAANPAAARGFMRAYLRACRDLQGAYMNEEIAAIIEQYTEIPSAVVAQSSHARYNPDGMVPLEDLQTLERFFLERGALEYAEPLDLSNFVNRELAAEIAAELDNE